jgi:hypothetical protein
MTDPLIGQIVAAGTRLPRWFYVTRVDGEAVYGRTWVTSRQSWTKGEQRYGRKAIEVLSPKAARPIQPPG